MPFIPHTQEEINEMLSVIGAKSLSDLYDSVPDALRMKRELDLPEPISEQDLLAELKSIGKKNLATDKALSFLGAGIYPHFTPSAVNDLAFRGEFLTPYTPYQPEISQGTLQVTFEFQSLMSRIFEMDISNASTYDLSTSVAEAALMALRIHKKKKKIIVCEGMHPEYREVLKTVLTPTNIEIVTLPHLNGKLNVKALKENLCDQTAACIVQYPNFFGIAENLEEASKLTHDADALFITATAEPFALGLLRTPGSFEADIAVGEGNSFGLPTRFGGPALGVFTASEKYLRQMPGRIVGENLDAQGRKGYVLTLSTREQHIRREKATSNICSNHQHCATIATIYLSLIGKHGFSSLARINAAKAQYAAQKLSSISGVKLQFEGNFFNEFVLELPKRAQDVLDALVKENIHAGVSLERWFPQCKNSLLLAFTEVHRKEDIDALATALTNAL